ncbi:MAG: hypothetical protein K2M29_02025 [Paramuribaculum sp.]|nr:hypothetical protein [Paramuribaculum sp.]
MKRKLLSQMCNEWRSNIWLSIELIIVSVVLWVIFMFLSWMTYISLREKGYTTDDIYVAEMKWIPDGANTYVPYDSAHSYTSDMQLLEQHIEQMPYVKYVGRGSNALPFNFNYHGSQFQTLDADSTSIAYYGNRRFMTADALRAIELRGRHGETTEQLIEMAKRGDLLFSDGDYHEWKIEDFIGKEVIMGSDSSSIRRVAAEIYPIPRSDYETTWGGTVVTLINDNDWAQQMIIKVKSGAGKRFEEAMTANEMRLGNVYLSNLRSIEKERKSVEIEVKRTRYSMGICAVFLMAVIFMGFLGTFWFRIQQRVPEIALRMVNGATRGDIFRRLLTEGFVMLISSTVIAVIIEILLCKYEVVIVNLVDIKRLSPVWGMAETFVALALMVLAGICIPARKAMSINPAEALKEE